MVPTKSSFLYPRESFYRVQLWSDGDGLFESFGGLVIHLLQENWEPSYGTACKPLYFGLAFFRFFFFILKPKDDWKIGKPPPNKIPDYATDTIRRVIRTARDFNFLPKPNI